jgi:hypothetical protein
MMPSREVHVQALAYSGVKAGHVRTISQQRWLSGVPYRRFLKNPRKHVSRITAPLRIGASIDP